MKKVIIFVCTSNTCRSPMAEAFGKEWLRENNMEDRYQVISRSISTDYEPEGSPASDHGIEVLKKIYGLNTSAHVSTLMTEEVANNAHIMIGVTRSHAQHLKMLFPEQIHKITSLSADVDDPWHQSISVYKRCAEKLKPLVCMAMETYAS